MQSTNPIKVRFDDTMRVGPLEFDEYGKPALWVELEVVAGNQSQRAFFRIPARPVGNDTHAVGLRDMHNTAVGLYSEVALRRQIESGGKGGRRRGRLEDVENYVREYLRYDNPHATAREIWDSIPTSLNASMEDRVYRDEHDGKPAVFQEAQPPRTEPHRLFFDAFRRYVHDVKIELRSLAQ